jgi:uracil permease
MEKEMPRKNPNLVLDVEENPKKPGQWILFALQHVLAMFIACITIPLLTGLPIAPALLSAGLGTLIYLLLTKKKSPVFLASSFAYVAPSLSALGVGMLYKVGNGNNNYMALILGMIMVGIVYVAVALVVKAFGTGWINKLLPPIIVGPVIMVIGLGLSSSAIGYLTNGPTTFLADGTMNGTLQNPGYNLLAILCGIVAMIVTACSSHYGKGKFISLIPFVIGMLSGYVLAALLTAFSYCFPAGSTGRAYMHIVDFTPLTSLFGDNFGIGTFFNYKMFVPEDSESFIFLRLDELKAYDWGKTGEVALLFIPVSFVTICEHIGDHENLGNIIGRDLLNGEPGMTRTLSGDGIATAVSGVLSGVANTTYGENVAVVGTTKIASANVVMLAAIMSCVFSFLTPISGFLYTIPKCVTGGISLILYGFIASSGFQMLMKNKVDFSISKNMYVASVILVSGIGGLSLKFGAPNEAPVITITSIAVSMILGILMNSILREPKKPLSGLEEHEDVKLVEKEEKALGQPIEPVSEPTVPVAVAPEKQ